jgi:hypothetical protein
VDEEEEGVTQKEIANRRELIDEKLSTLKYQESVVESDLQTLRSQCYHPGVTPSVKTEAFNPCPDCGWSGKS